MPAALVIVHSDSRFLDEALSALQADGHDVSGFTDAMVALAALETAQRVDFLISAVETPAGQPNGVSLALIARSKRRAVEVLFVGDEEAKAYTEGVGTLLVEPISAATIAERVREILATRSKQARAAARESGVDTHADPQRRLF